NAYKRQSEYIARPSYSLSEDITIDKPMLKANESFSFGFVDPMHESASWTLVDEGGNTVFTQSGHTVTVPDGLPKEGGYTLYINKGQVNERVFGYYVQVSGEKVGALPQIYTVSLDGQPVTGDEGPVDITLLDNPVLSYTGRSADGNASRAVQLASNYFGAKIGDLGINALQSISVAGWFKFKEIPSKYWHFMNISDRTTAWPNSEWGWTWNYGTPDGEYGSRFRGNASDTGSPGEIHYEFPDVRFQAGIWTHIAWICEYTTQPQTGFRHQLYINGVKQKGNVTQFVSGNGNDGQAIRSANGVTYDHIDSDTFVWGQNYAIGSDQHVYFGGPKHDGAAVDGVVDDFQVWNKAMSQSDVNASMAGFPDGYPSGMLCIWDFEDDIQSDLTFRSKGAKTGVKCSSFQAIGDQKGSEIVHTRSGYAVGCPFLSGTAMPVKTKATWSDNYRLTNFATAQADGNEGASGSATVNFNDAGDHNVVLSLENLYGKDQFEFPVFTVQQSAAIDAVTADGEGFDAYTEGNVLFLEFAVDGVYDVQVYNVSGMLVASKSLSAVAGQSAQVSLGTAGVYLVKAVKDGKILRTVKVLSK
ncbi:MAG: T9SS type A sorting domain-containing protein, partial [Paramuribaculum sp.]|nr:T9SS type A sorting domain-containing protein [Paramuribaculum sp.]